jgi:carboxypeptidase family protein
VNIIWLAHLRWLSAAAVGVSMLALLPGDVFAQTTGIAGLVRDTTGAVLPGVTVEASSPALIEKTRSAVTDGEGRYLIVDLRPGLYQVMFTLPGFASVVRTGIELPTAFTATVNAELKVGTLAETITVSGDAPTVDVHNTVQRQVVTREVLDALPSARSFEAIGQIIPGVVPTNPNRPSGQDVGGLAGERGHISIHGGNPQDMMSEVDGFSWLPGDGGNSGYTANPAEVQEFNFQLSGHMPETPNGGVRINLVPKEGGNRYSGFLFANFSNSALQSDNLTDDLIARGLTSVNKINKLWDVNPAIGGPIKQDRLWFFFSFRHLVDDYGVAGMFYPKDPKAFV